MLMVNRSASHTALLPSDRQIRRPEDGIWRSLWSEERTINTKAGDYPQGTDEGNPAGMRLPPQLREFGRYPFAYYPAV